MVGGCRFLEGGAFHYYYLQPTCELRVFAWLVVGRVSRVFAWLVVVDVWAGSDASELSVGQPAT